MPKDEPMTVFVGKLPANVPDQFIYSLLEQCGRVLEWKRVEGKSFGFCVYARPAQARRCINLMNGFKVDYQEILTKVGKKELAILAELEVSEEEAVQDEVAKERLQSVIQRRNFGARPVAAREEDKAATAGEAAAAAAAGVVAAAMAAAAEAGKEEHSSRTGASLMVERLTLAAGLPPSPETVREGRAQDTVVLSEVERFRMAEAQRDKRKEEERLRDLRRRVEEAERIERRQKEREAREAEAVAAVAAKEAAALERQKEKEKEREKSESSRGVRTSHSRSTSQEGGHHRRGSKEDRGDRTSSSSSSRSRERTSKRGRSRDDEREEGEEEEEEEEEEEDNRRRSSKKAAVEASADAGSSTLAPGPLQTKSRGSWTIALSAKSRAAGNNGKAKASGSSRGTTSAFQAGGEDEEDSGTKLRVPIPLDYDHDEKTPKLSTSTKSTTTNSSSSSGSGPALAPGMLSERQKRLVSEIPQDKEALFGYPVDWAIVDARNLVPVRLRAWVIKKIKELLGEEEPTLIDYICSKLSSHCRPDDLLAELRLVLEDDADIFTQKLWRIMIYYTIESRGD
jgi:RNA-binding protein 25